MVFPFIQGSFWKHQRNLYYKLFLILIVQLCQFSNQGGQLIKDANFFSCTQSESNKHLLVPITVEDEVSFTNKYSLIATINHSGTLNRGHLLLGFYQGHTLTLLVLLQWQIGFESWRKVSQQYYIRHPFLKKIWIFPRSYQKSWPFFLVFARGFWHFRQGVWWPHV